jgi:hypothetical protein
MSFPAGALVLLALPFIAAALIVAVSSVRRRRHASAAPPLHRLQSDVAAVQDATLPPRSAPAVTPGRQRRAESATRPTSPDRQHGERDGGTGPSLRSARVAVHVTSHARPGGQL